MADMVCCLIPVNFDSSSGERISLLFLERQEGYQYHWAIEYFLEDCTATVSN